MNRTYGSKKAKRVFHASRNKGKIKGVDNAREAVRKATY